MQYNVVRYAVASKDITVGEVVAVEKAIVSHMLPEYMGKNCSHCFKTMKSPLPCLTCTKVMFCSLKCRDEACSTYHQYECKLVDLFISSGMSIICYLAYRFLVFNSGYTQPHMLLVPCLILISCLLCIAVFYSSQLIS